ncbi:transposase [Microbulbifer sp. 2205BS26-8]|uniref:transposase n=1 Tax=Microbulbifer sp. 2205BS26-8 TaxID=3064386 RepID=UPI0035305D3C
MSYHQLSKEERYQICILLKAEHNQKEVATLLGRSPSMISRELKRNRGLRDYRPTQAQRFNNKRRSTAHKAIKVSDEVRSWIEKLLRQELSPQHNK